MGLTRMTAARQRLLAAEAGDLTGEQVCAEIARAVRQVAAYSAAAVITTDPETHLPAGGVVSGFDAAACAPFWDNELLDPDFNKFNDLIRANDPVATLSEVTDGDLERSPRYRKLYADLGASDELRIAFVSGSRCLAIAAFVRADGDCFSAEELCDVHALLVPATNALRSALAHSEALVTGAGPVVLILDERSRVLSRSAGAEDVLEDLMTGRLTDGGSLEEGGMLPGTLHVAASRARSSRSSTTLTTRLRGRSGRWVRVHIAPLEGTDGHVAMTIDGIRPSDLVPILLESYGLTERETDIVLALCRGGSTKEIAADLAISPHTVRDHLKAIFEKTRVNTRGELVAGLFSSHVSPLMHAATDRIEDPAPTR